MYNNRWINDRRKFQRLSVNISISYSVKNPPEVSNLYQDKEIDATMLNICEGGIGLLSRYNIPAYSIIVVKFTLFRTDRQGFITFSDPVEIISEVRHSVITEDGQYRLGVSFREVKNTAKSEITSFMESAMHM